MLRPQNDGGDSGRERISDTIFHVWMLWNDLLTFTLRAREAQLQMILIYFKKPTFIKSFTNWVRTKKIAIFHIC